MKKTLGILFIIIPLLCFSQIKWITFQEALDAQKTLPKKILIDFYTNGSESCKMMNENTYANKVISKYINENYYPVKFDAEGSEIVDYLGKTFNNPNFSKTKSKNSVHQFTQFMNVSSLPSIVFIDENQSPITILSGALTAKELEPYLTFITSNDYKKVKTRKEWDNYQKKFKSNIDE